jgi:outer membrane protein OmpA-like peptidoglycan-associated protein
MHRCAAATRLIARLTRTLRNALAALAALVALAALSAPALAASDPEDRPGSADPALFSRMPGFAISGFEVLDFDRYEFPTSREGKQLVEGRHVYLDYSIKSGVKEPSGLQVVRNYVNAARAVGGRSVYEFEDGGTQYATIKVTRKDAEAWVAVSAASNGMYKVHIIEKKLMDQEVVADANSLAASLLATGKAAVYGIYFDTDRAEIKPGSEAALKEIGRLLATDAVLRLYVVGHTDNRGAFEHNLQLSHARAAAVVQALVAQYGVARTRLTPYGDGPTAPVAANTTEEGRARNRRVELVAQ